MFAAVLVAVDGQHRLRSERLISRQGRESGVAQWVHAQAIKVGASTAQVDCTQVQTRGSSAAESAVGGPKVAACVLTLFTGLALMTTAFTLRLWCALKMGTPPVAAVPS